MNPTFRLGQVSGIEIGANWTWLLVVGLLVWSLAGGVFPATNPDLSDGAYVAMAAVATLLFFGSLVLHELGHALQAQREGMRIEGITLWVFGGVARFAGRFPSAGAELRIALAGPAVSLALGVLFLAVALALPLPPEVDGVVFWLGQINLVLLVFNMLPALPLDGGRVLRALLWRRRDFAQATRAAAGAGRFFGQLMIFAGLLSLIVGGTIGGAWLAFIGLFLLLAAESEGAAVRAEQAMEGLSVRDLMVVEPVTVDAELPLDRFMDDVFLRHRHTAYPVLEGGRPVGLLPFRAVVALPRESWPAKRARDAMVPSRRVPRLRPDGKLGEALTELAQSDLSRALVCEGEALEGLLSITDVARVLEARGVPAERAAAPPG